jgi:hypothetical protein
MGEPITEGLEGNEKNFFRFGGSSTMNRKSYLKIGMVVTGLSMALNAQTVTFNTPSAGMTVREQNIVATSQIDTSKLKGKKIKITLARFDGKKETVIKSGQYAVNDYSQKFELGSIKDANIGGSEFLRVKWEVPQTDMKGVIEPIGVSVLDSTSAKISLQAKKVTCEMNLAGVKAALSNDDWVALDQSQFAIVWNDKALGFLVKKGSDTNAVQLCIDGKNGKNAFLSFPDRMITYIPAKDSLVANYVKRRVDQDGIKYLPQQWENEIKKSAEGELVLVTVPWFDLGMIPFDERVIGFSVFRLDAQEAAVNAFPATAKKEIPGTWGNLKIVAKKS